jgi:hypothetical protein
VLSIPEKILEEPPGEIAGSDQQYAEYDRNS